MPSVRYYNQTAPFWDFVASLENQGSQHPAFAASRPDERNDSGEENPWTGPWGGWAHRGWHRGHPRGHHQHRGPPPPGPDGQSPPPPTSENEGSPSSEHEKVTQPPANDGLSTQPSGCSAHEGNTHRCGRRGGRGFGRGGRCGGPGFFPATGFPFNMNNLAEYFQSQVFGQENEEGDKTARGSTEDFKPDADVFDTENSYIIHVSLPGAKKEDVGVNWDPEKSELSIAGVVYRPGDEDLLKTLALDERKIGAFERKIRLGSRANPAQVEADSITAKLEDGILRVDVPKLDKDYVEIKKVDIE